MMSKVGRNDPCPCGSGKKHKRCCLPLRNGQDANEAVWQNLRAAWDRLAAQLLHFAEKQLPEEIIAEASEEFVLWQAPPEDEDGELVDLTPAFLPWLIYTHVPDALGEDGVTRPGWPQKPIAQLFLDAQRDHLSDLERRFIDAACEAHWSFYAVESVDPGHGLRIRDLLTGDMRDVREAMASEMIETDDVVFAATVSLDGVTIILGNGPLLVPAARQTELLALRETLAGEPRALRADELFEHEHRIRQWYLDLVREIYQTGLPTENADGDPIEPRRIEFELDCTAAEALAALAPMALDRSHAQLVGDAQRDATGALHAVSFDWLTRGNTADPQADSTVLGQLSIEGSRLEAQVNSEARAILARSEIETRLESRVRYRAEHRDSLDDEELESAPDWSSPEVSQLVARHWREWVDRPLEALANETPRQAAKTERGRERLRSLLAVYSTYDRGAGSPFGGPDDATLELLGLLER